MEDFESKEYRCYLSPMQASDIDGNLEITSVKLAEVDLDSDILLAAHRC